MVEKRKIKHLKYILYLNTKDTHEILGGIFPFWPYTLVFVLCVECKLCLQWQCDKKE